MQIFQVCRESGFFYKRNFAAIVMVLLPAVVLNEFFYSMIPAGTENSSPGIIIWLPLLLLPVYQAALIVLLASSVKGERLSVLECYREGLPSYLRLAAVYLMSGLLLMLGFLALVIPGLILMSRLILAEFYAVVEGRPAYESLSDSWTRIKSNTWPVLGGYILMIIVATVPALAVSGMFEELEMVNVVTSFIESALSTILSALPTVYCFRIYCLMREEQQTQPADLNNPL